MKNSTKTLLIVTLMTTAQNAFAAPECNPKAVAIEMPSTLVVFHDYRPFNSALETVTVQKNPTGKFDVTFDRLYIDQATGKEVQETKSLGSNMLCVADSVKYICSVDARPVDGALYEVVIASNEMDNFNVFIRRSWIDRFRGEEVQTTKSLLTDMNLAKK